MSILALIGTHLGTVFSGVLGVFSIFLLGRNSKLASENENLKAETQTQEKIITIQNKVLDAAKDTPDVDLDGNIARMQNDKL